MRPTLVFLHGWGYRPSLWDDVRAELADWPSSAPDLPEGAEAVDAWAAQLATTLPDGAMLVGWSLGALLALLLAARQPDKVRGLYLIGATPRFVASADWPHGLDAATVSAFRAGFASAPERTLRRFLALQLKGDAQPARLQPRLEAALAAADSPLLAPGLALLEACDLRPLLAAISQPMHLLHGRHDALMPLGAAQWLASHSASARLEIIDEAGHAPLFDQPAALAERIRKLADAC